MELVAATWPLEWEQQLNAFQMERSNRPNTMFIKTKISVAIRGSFDKNDNIKELLKAIDEQFETSNKVLASTLMMKFTYLKLTSMRGMREHIMQIRDIAAQLKTLEAKDNSFNFAVEELQSRRRLDFGNRGKDLSSDMNVIEEEEYNVDEARLDDYTI
ncbi:hypothetical protein PanWU01x14_310290 [Parasponia andersonii]|uniref:UBN2 domain-containing protein n=1 Tax=Parasponia andersonii TaxID=3476 RepID=A0A2P5AQE5_PARAD|nr:hypothetical protein PanWU01x14_310290 [Parasponia andersonii]